MTSVRGRALKKVSRVVDYTPSTTKPATRLHLYSASPYLLLHISLFIMTLYSGGTLCSMFLNSI